MLQKEKTLLRKLWETSWGHLYDKLNRETNNVPLFQSTSFFNQFFGQSNNKVNVDTNLQLLTDWAWAAINYRSHNFAKVKWNLRLRVSRDEYKEIKSHAMYDLFYRVNEEYSEYDLFYLMQSAYDVVGDAYWYVELDKLFESPIEITPIFPDMGKMYKHRNEYGKIWKYTLRTSAGKDIVFDPKNIFNYRALDLSDSSHGVPLMTKILRNVYTSSSIKDYQKNLLDNQAVPSGILTTDVVFNNPIEFKRENDKFNSVYAGAMNAGKVMLLDGKTRFQVLGLSPRDLDLINGSNMTRDDIIAMSMVPRIAFGLNASTTLADAFAQRLMFAENWLHASVMMRDSRMSQDFCQKYYKQVGNTFLEMYSENVIPNNALEKADLFNKVGQGGYKVAKEYVAKELGIPEDMLIDMDEITESQIVDIKKSLDKS